MVRSITQTPSISQEHKALLTSTARLYKISELTCSFSFFAPSPLIIFAVNDGFFYFLTSSVESFCASHPAVCLACFSISLRFFALLGSFCPSFSTLLPTVLTIFSQQLCPACSWLHLPIHIGLFLTHAFQDISQLTLCLVLLSSLVIPRHLPASSAFINNLSFYKALHSFMKILFHS